MALQRRDYGGVRSRVSGSVSIVSVAGSGPRVRAEVGRW